MKLRILLLTFLIFFFCDQSTNGQIILKDVTDFVNPFAGTAGDHGQTDPSANIPFGMIKPGPDTKPEGHGGYDYNATRLTGFSQNRMSGTGCNGVGGNLRILPYTGKYSGVADMNKSSEIASPGYYAVDLLNGIKTEITAGRTSAIYRFGFPRSEVPGICIDFRSSFARFIKEKHNIIGGKAVEGQIKCKCTCDKGAYMVYYHLETDRVPEKTVEDEGKLFWTFNSSENENIIVKIGMSSVSTDNARANMNAETGQKSFDDIRQEATDEWHKILNAVQVDTDDDSLKQVFYTNLYRACQTPFDIIDHSGYYRGNNGKIYYSREDSYYHGWSIWDTFRTKYPLFSLLFPEQYKDMMFSLTKLYKQRKVDWASNREPFLTTRTEHSIIILLDAIEKGFPVEQVEGIFPYMIREARKLPMTSPDKILESCYDFWGISKIAGLLGYATIENQFLEKSREYRAIWTEKFLNMGETGDIMHGDGLYEGTLWQYRWFVPYDQEWMVNTIGGRVKTIEELDYFFDNNLFNIGNQPDIQVPFLYYYLGQPWKSQKLVRKILLEPTVNYYGTHDKWETPYIGKVFTAGPEGYLKEMDDDAGTMSSWFVLSSIGLYPVCPGIPKFWILPPVFNRVVIDVGDGKKFTINAKHSDGNEYIREVRLNGENITRSWLNYTEISEGGTLTIELGATPDKVWGTNGMQAFKEH